MLSKGGEIVCVIGCEPCVVETRFPVAPVLVYSFDVAFVPCERGEHIEFAVLACGQSVGCFEVGVVAVAVAQTCVSVGCFRLSG